LFASNLPFTKGNSRAQAEAIRPVVLDHRRRVWNKWSEALVLVRPDSVVSGHRAGCRCSEDADLATDSDGRRWRGSPILNAPPEKRKSELGAPSHPWRVGFDNSEPTVSRYLKRLKRIPDESEASQWHAFLNNHREVIAAFDFFTVRNLYFRTLYCFFLSNIPAGAFCTSTLGSIEQAILDNPTTTRSISAAVSLPVRLVRS